MDSCCSILIYFDPQIWYCNLWKPGNSMNLGDSWDRSPGRSGRQSLSDSHMRLMARDALKKSHPATKIQLWGGYENLEIPWNPIKSQLLRCNLMWIVFWWSSSVVLDYNFEWQMIPMTWDNPTNPSDSSGFRSQLSERATQSGIEGDHICHST